MKPITIHHRPARGSALILTVVLTTLLAIVGVLFVLTSRLDKMGTTATTQNRQLSMAVDSVIAMLSDELVRDVPGVAGQEYYDYPDANNVWLSSLEPFEQGGDYYWRQISHLSDVYDPTYQKVKIEIVSDRAPFTDVNTATGEILNNTLADADGDGVGDAYWYYLKDVSTSYGRPVYAAVRVIDNGGMLNANTAYKFNLMGSSTALVKTDFDGSNVMQIDLLALVNDKKVGADQLARILQGARSDTLNIEDYLKGVVWDFNEPSRHFQPFDLSDEMELRNRYFLNHDDIKTRIEDESNRWGDISKERK